MFQQINDKEENILLGDTVHIMCFSPIDRVFEHVLDHFGPTYIASTHKGNKLATLAGPMYECAPDLHSLLLSSS